MAVEFHLALAPKGIFLLQGPVLDNISSDVALGKWEIAKVSDLPWIENSTAQSKAIAANGRYPGYILHRSCANQKEEKQRKATIFHKIKFQRLIIMFPNSQFSFKFNFLAFS
jgi:hypothetical protein